MGVGAGGGGERSWKVVVVGLFVGPKNLKNAYPENGECVNGLCGRWMGFHDEGEFDHPEAHHIQDCGCSGTCS